MVTFIPDPMTPSEAESDARTRGAFDALRVHAIYGTGRWDSISIDQAAALQRALPPQSRPVFVLDRCSVDEDVLDIDIIDIRVQLVLAAAGGSKAAAEFGMYSGQMYALGLGLSPVEEAWASQTALLTEHSPATPAMANTSGGSLEDPLLRLHAGLEAVAPHASN